MSKIRSEKLNSLFLIEKKIYPKQIFIVQHFSFFVVDWLSFSSFVFSSVHFFDSHHDVYDMPEQLFQYHMFLKQQMSNRRVFVDFLRLFRGQNVNGIRSNSR